MNVFEKPKRIIVELKNNGYEAFFVGGSVRDLLMNRQIGDIDITTSAPPEEVMRIFPKNVPIGIQHGTVLVLHSGEGYEVTTYRTESEYENFRTPKEVQFVNNLDEDLKRRDFTMNAIAMNESEEIYDPFHGADDIKRRVIVTVGDPNERFREDALRMLRALRFMSTLDFTLDEDTEKAIKENVALLQHISVERKLVEFDKLLIGGNAFQALHKMKSLHVIDYLPYLKEEESAFGQFIQDMSQFHEKSLPLMWGILMYRLEGDSRAILQSWKMSSKRMNEIIAIVKVMRAVMEDKMWKRQLILQYGYEICHIANTILLTLHLATIANDFLEEWQQMVIKDRQELAVTGNHLQKWLRRKPGPWIQIELDKIITAVLYGEIQNDEVMIKEWLEHEV